MSDEDESSFDAGDIVWVKLGNHWWPGEVVSEKNVPQEVLDSHKKQPIAIVKFFKEDTYEFVKNIAHIFPYDCTKKNDFIRKGLELYRANNNKYMEKFPSDIEVAEEATNGDVNILKRKEFAPSKKLNYATIFGDQTKKTKKGKDLASKGGKRSVNNKNDHHNTSGGSNRGRRSSQFQQSPIISRKSVNEKNHESRIIPQSNIQTSPDTSPSTYKCHLCDFTSIRQNVIVLHAKAHKAPIIPSKSEKLKSILKKTDTSRETTDIPAAPVEPIESSSIDDFEGEESSVHKNANKSVKPTEMMVSIERKNENGRKSRKIKHNDENCTSIPYTLQFSSPQSSNSSNKEIPITKLDDTTNPSSIVPSGRKKTDTENEIRTKLLADWSDEDDDGTQKRKSYEELSTVESLQIPTRLDIPLRMEEPTKLDNELAELIKQSNLSSTDLPTNATSTPKYRNIPKKDRRDVVLKDFNNSMEACKPINTSTTNSSPDTAEIESSQNLKELETSENSVDEIYCINVEHSSQQNESAELTDNSVDFASSRFDSPVSTVSPSIEILSNREKRSLRSASNSSDKYKKINENHYPIETIDLCNIDESIEEVDNDGKKVDVEKTIEENAENDEKTSTEENSVAISNELDAHKKPGISLEQKEICAKQQKHDEKSLISCFDFKEDEEEQGDFLSSISKLKKKYMSPEKERESIDSKDQEPQDEIVKLEVEKKDKQLSDDIEKLLNSTQLPDIIVDDNMIKSPSFSPTPSSSMTPEVRTLPPKERGKRIFKSRNRSKYEETSISSSLNLSSTSSMEEKKLDKRSESTESVQNSNRTDLEANSAEITNKLTIEAEIPKDESEIKEDTKSNDQVLEYENDIVEPISRPLREDKFNDTTHTLSQLSANEFESDAKEKIEEIHTINIEQEEKSDMIPLLDKEVIDSNYRNELVVAEALISIPSKLDEMESKMFKNNSEDNTIQDNHKPFENQEKESFSITQVDNVHDLSGEADLSALNKHQEDVPAKMEIKTEKLPQRKRRAHMKVTPRKRIIQEQGEIPTVVNNSEKQISHDSARDQENESLTEKPPLNEQECKIEIESKQKNLDDVVVTEKQSLENHSSNLPSTSTEVEQSTATSDNFVEKYIKDAMMFDSSHLLEQDELKDTNKEYQSNTTIMKSQGEGNDTAKKQFTGTEITKLLDLESMGMRADTPKNEEIERNLRLVKQPEILDSSKPDSTTKTDLETVPTMSNEHIAMNENYQKTLTKISDDKISAISGISEERVSLMQIPNATEPELETKSPEMDKTDIKDDLKNFRRKSRELINLLQSVDMGRGRSKSPSEIEQKEVCRDIPEKLEYDHKEISNLRSFRPRKAKENIDARIRASLSPPLPPDKTTQKPSNISGTGLYAELIQAQKSGSLKEAIKTSKLDSEHRLSQEEQENDDKSVIESPGKTVIIQEITESSNNQINTTKDTTLEKQKDVPKESHEIQAAFKSNSEKLSKANSDTSDLIVVNKSKIEFISQDIQKHEKQENVAINALPISKKNIEIISNETIKSPIILHQVKQKSSIPAGQQKENTVILIGETSSSSTISNKLITSPQKLNLVEHKVGSIVRVPKKRKQEFDFEESIIPSVIKKPTTEALKKATEKVISKENVVKIRKQLQPQLLTQSKPQPQPQQQKQNQQQKPSQKQQLQQSPKQQQFKQKVISKTVDETMLDINNLSIYLSNESAVHGDSNVNQQVHLVVTPCSNPATITVSESTPPSLAATSSAKLSGNKKKAVKQSSTGATNEPKLKSKPCSKMISHDEPKQIGVDGKGNKFLIVRSENGAKMFITGPDLPKSEQRDSVSSTNLPTIQQQHCKNQPPVPQTNEHQTFQSQTKTISSKSGASFEKANIISSQVINPTTGKHILSKASGGPSLPVGNDSNLVITSKGNLCANINKLSTVSSTGKSIDSRNKQRSVAVSQICTITSVPVSTSTSISAIATAAEAEAKAAAAAAAAAAASSLTRRLSRQGTTLQPLTGDRIIRQQTIVEETPRIIIQQKTIVDDISSLTVMQQQEPGEISASEAAELTSRFGFIEVQQLHSPEPINVTGNKKVETVTSTKTVKQKTSRKPKTKISQKVVTAGPENLISSPTNKFHDGPNAEIPPLVALGDSQITQYHQPKKPSPQIQQQQQQQPKLPVKRKNILSPTQITTTSSTTKLTKPVQTVQGVQVIQPVQYTAGTGLSTPDPTTSSVENIFNDPTTSSLSEIKDNQKLIAVPGESFGGPKGSFYLCTAENDELVQFDGTALYLDKNNSLHPMPSDPSVTADDGIVSIQGTHVLVRADEENQHILSDVSQLSGERFIVNTEDGQQLLLDEESFMALVANGVNSPDAAQIVTIDGQQMIITPDVLASVNNGDVSGPILLTTIDRQLTTSNPDILATALAGTEVYHQDQLLQIDSGNVLQIETSNGVQIIERGIAFQPINPPVTAQTSETNALLTQPPIMSTLEVPSSKKKAKLDLSTSKTNESGLIGQNLDDSLAVIGVNTQPSAVPSSLNLPITITNPAIAPKPTSNPITLSSIYPSGLGQGSQISPTLSSISHDQELVGGFELFTSSIESHSQQQDGLIECESVDVGKIETIEQQHQHPSHHHHSIETGEIIMATFSTDPEGHHYPNEFIVHSEVLNQPQEQEQELQQQHQHSAGNYDETTR